MVVSDPSDSREIFFHLLFVVLIIYESQVPLYGFRVQKDRPLCTVRQRVTGAETDHTNS